MDHELPIPIPQPESGLAFSVVPQESKPAKVLNRPKIEDISREIVNVPNSLTLLRIFLVPFLVVVLLTKFEGKEYAGLAIFLVAALTDFLDGYIARRFHKVTRIGMLLDPIADKVLISAALISLVELKLAPAWMIVIIIGREFAVSGLRSIASQQGVSIAASPLGKGKMISQVVAIALLILGDKLSEFKFVGKSMLWVVMIFALASGIDYFMKFTRAILRPPDDPEEGE
ncbi:MAG TPA: CDP-diacylglycerol--glycerol-3-phosphate 3-phosphatidyltransferase [Thermoanaerobaculia bacterium]|nr:CDP-diacylglycerol--glycerol-3-phosphate 3-phosphatidyltransferase [Thermoanaerobaculia bacterium]